VKIYLKNEKFLQEDSEILAKILPGAVFFLKKGFLEVKKTEPGKIFDKVPKLENLPFVKSVEMENRELMPLVYSGKNFIFRKPIDFSRKGIRVIAGPCVIAGWEDFYETALRLKAAGADALRAPIFKPRSSPYCYEGPGFSALPLLRKVKKASGLPLVTEVLDPRNVEKTASVCDVIQIGARSMKNYPLLKEAAASGLPVLLKRQPQSSLREFLFSAEYLLKYGAGRIIMCERGDALPGAGGRLDAGIIRELRSETGLPVVADPSHSARKRELVYGFSLDAVEAGADGLMIETCLRPERSRIDTRQIIGVEELERIILAVNAMGGRGNSKTSKTSKTSEKVKRMENREQKLA